MAGEDYRNSSNASAAKRRALLLCQVDQEVDKISQLPEPLIDRILSLLPIRDAVRTSVLSSKWRFKYTTLSKLVFDDKCVSPGGNSKSNSREFVKIIDNVLLLHSGVIEKFNLCHPRYKATCDIDRWIRYLSKASISELILTLWGPLYEVPSCLFSCERLTWLELYNCSFTLPPTFRGFKNLKVLTLESVPLSEQVLENLVSGSCHLEWMTLNEYHFKNLNLDAPKLRYLYFEGLLEGISFKNTYSAPLFHMVLEENKAYFSEEVDAVTGYINLLEFFAPLQNAQTLIFDGYILQYLSVQKVPAMLAEPLPGLEFLLLKGVHFNSANEISIILCLLRSAPNLKQVQLSVPAMEEDIEKVDIVGVDDCSGTVEEYNSTYTFAQLNSASLIGISYSALEVGFIGVLLSNSPALQKVIIKASRRLSEKISIREYNLLKRLLRSQCASTQTEVLFVD